MNRRQSDNSIWDIILYVLLFLSCFNFLGRGPVFFLVFSLYGIVKSRNRPWSATCWLYLLLAIIAFFVSILFFEIEACFKAFVYFLSFYAGYCVYVSSYDKVKMLSNLLFFGVLGFVSYLLFIAYINFRIIGHNAGVRNLINPWNSDNIAVTLVGLVSSVPIVYSFYCLFCQKSLLLKVIGTLYLILSLWINIETATRTPFLLMAIVYAIMFYEMLGDANKKRRMWIVLILLIIGIIFSRSVLPVFYQSAIGERFLEEGIKTSRWEIMVYYFSQMLVHPFGGGFAQQNYDRLAHDVIQESYDYYGVFFFIVFIFIIIGMIRRIHSLHKINNKSPFAYLSLSLYVGIGIQVMLEPVIIGYPQLLWFLFLIDGIMVGAFFDKQNVLLFRNNQSNC